MQVINISDRVTKILNCLNYEKQFIDWESMAYAAECKAIAFCRHYLKVDEGQLMSSFMKLSVVHFSVIYC
ncbi:hypothetical protein C9J48_11600 [Photobacterium profundum]|uniref:Uncharacterized protein n=1 Tax=Photobacterium profundum 3TCK TaxID=314280 RepID=Q1YVS6_9GAMM|nr:hypothetical protein [Photobacterium profundum]EAS40382.1 hypothetical protein P3TCK_07971 [Photobacterium profundum 3TCK]PSV62589.1 hypothetical protein C9J48_11600 [Photobacterium profundum]